MPTQDEIDEAMMDQQMMLAQQQQMHPWPVIAANIAIYAGVSFIRLAIYNPIQRLTIIINTEEELVRQGILTAPLGGVVPTVKHLMLTEGLFGATFRGCVSDALLSLPVRLIEDFVSNTVSGVLQSFFGEAIMHWSQLRLLTVSIGASAVAMYACIPVSYPREAILTRMMTDVRPEAQAQDGSYRYSGPISAYRSFKTIGSLFSGCLVGVANLLVYRSVFYYTLNGVLSVVGTSHPIVTKLSTIACTFLSSIAHHPLDVIRQRMIVSADGPKPHGSSKACAEHIVKKEGYAGLFRGLKFKLVTTAVNILVVELINGLQSS